MKINDIKFYICEKCSTIQTDLDKIGECFLCSSKDMLKKHESLNMDKNRC